jgi:hypothetical protein
VQGVVAGGEFLLAGGGAVVAPVGRGCGFGGGTQAGQSGFAGGGADLAELISPMAFCLVRSSRLGLSCA